MKDFVYQNETKILFGKECLEGLAAECQKLGNTILLHYGGGSIKKSGLYDRVREILSGAGKQIIELGGVKPNPRLSLVHEGIELCRKEGVDGILAVGGGSVIDSAKAIAMGVPYDKDVWDFYMGEGAPESILPLGTILTIPAAGSEASNSSVITREDLQLKKGTTQDLMRPLFSFMNPEWTFTLPPYQTACGITDMMAHIMERYFTPVKNVALTDQMCEAVLRTIISQAPVVMANPRDYNARAEIMWAGTLAHNDLLGTGREGDWGSHGLEHEISALNDLAHGAGLAIIFPAWLSHVASRDWSRMARFARKVMGVVEDNDQAAAEKGIAALKAFFNSIGMPGSLSETGLDETSVSVMAGKATANGSFTLGAYGQLTLSDAEAVYRRAL